MSILIINSLEYDRIHISKNIIELIIFSRKLKIPILWFNNSKTITEFEKKYKYTKDFTFDEKNIFYYLKKYKIRKIYLTNFTTNDLIKDLLKKIKELGIAYYLVSDFILDSQEKENIINFEKFKENNTLFGTKSFLILDALDLDIEIETLKKEIKFSNMNSHGSPVPRLIAIQGEIIDGKYPLYRHPADEQPFITEFSKTTKLIRDKLSKILKQEFNHVLIQYYRNGDDNIGEHSDKTLDIKKGTNIINYSIGATRTMVLKKKSTHEKEYIHLLNNSVFSLSPDTNKEWLHSIKQDCRLDKQKDADELAYNGERISFTFRTIATFVDEFGNIQGQGEPKIKGIDDKLDMLKAFSKENHQNDFNYEEYYANGFNAINFKFINN